MEGPEVEKGKKDKNFSNNLEKILFKSYFTSYRTRKLAFVLKHGSRQWSPLICRCLETLVKGLVSGHLEPHPPFGIETRHHRVEVVSKR